MAGRIWPEVNERSPLSQFLLMLPATAGRTAAEMCTDGAESREERPAV